MKTKYAEFEFFKYLIAHYDGITALSERLNVDFFDVNNWLHRGYVPAKDVRDISKKIGIPPCVLNNKQFHYICDWKALLNEVKFLKPEELKTLLKLPVRYK